MQEKRERGLCFRCDERFSPGHRCKQKTLQVLWVTDDEEDDGIDPPLPDEAAGEVELADGPTTAVLCISSMVGFCPPHSMKVRGKIKAREVIVLIDSGASHNFISEHIVSELQLRCDPTQKFGVQMGNGDEVKTSGVCRVLCLQLAKIEVMADFFSLEVGHLRCSLGFSMVGNVGGFSNELGKSLLTSHFRRGKGQDPRRPDFIQISSILEQFDSYTKTRRSRHFGGVADNHRK